MTLSRSKMTDQDFENIQKNGHLQWLADTTVESYERQPYYRNRMLPPIVYQLVESLAQLQEYWDEGGR